MCWLIDINMVKQLHLEQQIEQFEPQLDQFETLKAEGNYVQAHNHIAGLNETMTQLKTYGRNSGINS